MAYMAPKMDLALSKVHRLTGLQLPIDKVRPGWRRASAARWRVSLLTLLCRLCGQDMYPLIVLGAGCMELLGGVLFTLNVQLGAVLLVGVRAAAKTRNAPPGSAAALPGRAMAGRGLTRRMRRTRAVPQMLFLVPTSVVMHNFWDLEPATPAHQIEFINFMKARVGQQARAAGCLAAAGGYRQRQLPAHSRRRRQMQAPAGIGLPCTALRT